LPAYAELCPNGYNSGTTARNIYFNKIIVLINSNFKVKMFYGVTESAFIKNGYGNC